MLRVKTKLGISHIPGAGIGLFADEFIPKGAIIWEYHQGLDQVFEEAEFNRHSSLIRNFLITYCFRYDGKYYLCIDNARFFNHGEGDAANCYSDEFDKFNMGYTKAKRDIHPGEELLDDYLGFGLTEEDKKYNKLS
jgi:SET domain-containing protein